MSTKKCSLCKEIKDIDCFGSDKYKKDGKTYRCKKCINEAAIKREKKKIIFQCSSCGEEKLVDFYTNRRRKTDFCLACFSKETQTGIKKPKITGEKSSRWKGGLYISSDGYKMIKCDNEFHPSGRQKYKPEHIIVYEEFLGRKLKTQRGYMGEQIHHIDGDKLNNNLDNLEYSKDTREHRNFHAQLENIAYDLVKLGIICYDRINKKYFINESRIT